MNSHLRHLVNRETRPTIRRPSVVERLLRQSLAGLAGTVVQGAVLIVLIVAGLLLGAMVFASVGGVLFGAYVLLGQPPALASPVGVGWFFGSLLILFLLLRRAHRWMTLALDATQIVESVISPETEERAAPMGPSSVEGNFEARLAAADARHAPTGPSPLDQARPGENA